MVLPDGAALPRYAAVACGSGVAPPRTFHRTDSGAAQLFAPQCARGCAADGSALMHSATLRPRWLWAAPVHQALSAQSCLWGAASHLLGLTWATLVSQIADITTELLVNRQPWRW